MGNEFLRVFLIGFCGVLLFSWKAEATWPTLFGFSARLNNSRTVLQIRGRFRYPSNEVGDPARKEAEARRQNQSTCENFARGWDPRGPETRIVVVRMGAAIATHHRNPNNPTGRFVFNCVVEPRF